jgi:hypothetical protein
VADTLEERAEAYILEQKAGLGNPLQKSNLVTFARDERRRVWDAVLELVKNQSDTYSKHPVSDLVPSALYKFEAVHSLLQRLSAMAEKERDDG